MNIDKPASRHIQGLKALWHEAFGDSDSFIESFFDTAFTSDRCLVVTEGNELIAALYWFDCSSMGKKIAYIYAVAVAKAHRERGIGKRLIESAHLRLGSLGYEGSMLVPGGKELFGFYKKLGYRTVGCKSKITCRSSNKSTIVRSIGIEEYASLRLNYLPKGGVVQDKENLGFLERQAKMYAGVDFLLAARIADKRLLGIELLGNVDVAADIVCSLGCQEGEFYTVGDDIPFAMYYSLGDKEFSPSYFGLAFD